MSCLQLGPVLVGMLLFAGGDRDLLCLREDQDVEARRWKDRSRYLNGVMLSGWVKKSGGQ